MLSSFTRLKGKFTRKGIIDVNEISLRVVSQVFAKHDEYACGKRSENNGNGAKFAKIRGTISYLTLLCLMRTACTRPTDICVSLSVQAESLKTFSWSLHVTRPTSRYGRRYSYRITWRHGEWNEEISKSGTVRNGTDLKTKKKKKKAKIFSDVTFGVGL